MLIPTDATASLMRACASTITVCGLQLNNQRLEHWCSCAGCEEIEHSSGVTDLTTEAQTDFQFTCTRQAFDNPWECRRRACRVSLHIRVLGDATHLERPQPRQHVFDNEIGCKRFVAYGVTTGHIEIYERFAASEKK